MGLQGFNSWLYTKLYTYTCRPNKIENKRIPPREKDKDKNFVPESIMKFFNFFYKINVETKKPEAFKDITSSGLISYKAPNIIYIDINTLLKQLKYNKFIKNRKNKIQQEQKIDINLPEDGKDIQFYMITDICKVIEIICHYIVYIKRLQDDNSDIKIVLTIDGKEPRKKDKENTLDEDLYKYFIFSLLKYLLSKSGSIIDESFSEDIKARIEEQLMRPLNLVSNNFSPLIARLIIDICNKYSSILSGHNILDILPVDYKQTDKSGKLELSYKKIQENKIDFRVILNFVKNYIFSKYETEISKIDLIQKNEAEHSIIENIVLTYENASITNKQSIYIDSSDADIIIILLMNKTIISTLYNSWFNGSNYDIFIIQECCGESMSYIVSLRYILFKLFDFKYSTIRTIPNDELFKQTCNFGCLCLLSSTNDFCTSTCCTTILSSSDGSKYYDCAFNTSKLLKYNIITENTESKCIVINLSDIILKESIDYQKIVWLLMYYYLNIPEMIKKEDFTLNVSETRGIMNKCYIYDTIIKIILQLGQPSSKAIASTDRRFSKSLIPQVSVQPLTKLKPCICNDLYKQAFELGQENKLEFITFKDVKDKLSQREVCNPRIKNLVCNGIELNRQFNEGKKYPPKPQTYLRPSINGGNNSNISLNQIYKSYQQKYNLF